MRILLTLLAFSLPAVLAVQSPVSLAHRSTGNVAVAYASGNAQTSADMRNQNATSEGGIIDKIIFIKLHNVGGSTLQSILHRFCEFHLKSCYVFPSGERTGVTLETDDLRSIVSTFQSEEMPTLDIFANHMVMDTSLLDTLVPDNFKFSLLRLPVDRLMSSMRYCFDAQKVLEIMQLLQLDRESGQCGLPIMSAQMTPEQVDDLDLVMLTEEYDKSLMMLRKALGWSMFDMMYRKLKEHTDEDLRNVTAAFEAYLSQPEDQLNNATRAYLKSCAGPNESMLYLNAKTRFQTQWDQFSDSERHQLLADMATFQAGRDTLENCCESAPEDSYCVGLLEDNKDWNQRYYSQGHSYTTIGLSGDTIASPVTRESACMLVVKFALGES